MSRIALFMAEDEDSRRLAEMLAAGGHEVSRLERPPDKPPPFDLLIIDPEHLTPHQDWLLELRQADEPVLLPVLLVAPGQRLAELDPDPLRVVSEFLPLPLNPAEFKFRLNSILRTCENLRQAEAKYHVLAEQNPMAITVMDREGRITYANQRAEEVFGIDRGEITSRLHNSLAWKITDYEGNPIAVAGLPFSQVMARGRPLHGYRLAIEHPDGKRLYLRVDAAPLFDSSGQPNGVLATVEDVTERLLTQRSLKESEERFRSLFDHMSAGVAIFEAGERGSDFLFQDINQAGERISRVRREDVLGASLRASLPGAEEMGLLAAMRRVWHSGRPEDLGVRKYRDQNVEYWLDNYIFRLPSGQVVTVHEDVTAQVEAENALRESENRYRDLYENAPTAFFTVRAADVTISGCNRTLERLLDLDRKALVGREVYDLFDQGPEGAELVRRVLKGVRQGRAAEGVELRMRKRDGSSFWVEAHLTPVPDAQGLTLEYRAIVFDITPRKQLEKQLRQSQKMEALGTLAGGIVHDMNNILTPILGFSDIAREEMPEDSRLGRDLRQISEAALRARNLVNQILTFTRQSERSMAPVSAKAMVKEPLKLLRSSLPSTIEIRQSIKPGDYTITADPTQMHQVIMNLAINAAQAMSDKGGVLEVSMDEVDLGPHPDGEAPGLAPGRYVRIQVSDTGAGMAPEVAARVFEPYFTTKTPGEGTGLGLSVVHGIIESHKGAISVRSRPGEGSVFTIHLLRTADQKPEETRRPFAKLPKGSGRILLVDDEMSVGSFLETALGRLGYEVDFFSSSPKALAAFGQNPDGWDLVITDQTMPQLKGTDLSAEIYKVRPDLPVVLCTGYSNDLDETKTRGAGIRAVLMKPVDLTGLAETISGLLGGAK